MFVKKQINNTINSIKNERLYEVEFGTYSNRLKK